MRLRAALPPPRLNACGVAHPPGAIASCVRMRMRAIWRKRGSKRVQVGLRQAARMTGRNQSTVHRAMRTGRLSFTVNEAGERRIDLAELERVFGIKSPPQGTAAVSTEQALDRLRRRLQATLRMRVRSPHWSACWPSVRQALRDRTRRFAIYGAVSTPRSRSGVGCKSD